MSLIVALNAAGEGDAHARGQQRFGSGTAAGSEELAAVDHRRGHRAAAEHRSRAGTPSGSGVALGVFGGGVAQQREEVVALDEREALGKEAFQLDGADLGAVLRALGALLRALVGVEPAADAVDASMDEAYQRPQQVGFEAHLAEAVLR